MTRPAAAIGSILFFFLAPGTVAGVIPWWMTRWDFSSTTPPLIAFGATWVSIGLIALLRCFVRFATDGQGTPAPVAPTRTLVVTGLYRRVRNPMYVAVTLILFGQAVMFSSAALIAYGLAVWLAFQAFILIYEEPTLRETYGDQYTAYCAAVPRPFRAHRSSHG
eukprot:gene16404-21743_t